MYRKILLAYDGSQAGHEALRQGSDLAVTCQANVFLLAVLAPEFGMILAGAVAPFDLPDLPWDEVQRVLMEGAKELHNAGLSVETRLVTGNPAEKIGDVAQEIGADLVVVGHRDQSPLARWWKGSTGASLLAHAPCSLLIAVSKHQPG